MLLLNTEKLPEGPDWSYEIKSDGSVTIKGTSGVTVEASGPLKLKGATVDIEASATVNVKGSLINIG